MPPRPGPPGSILGLRPYGECSHDTGRARQPVRASPPGPAVAWILFVVVAPPAPGRALVVVEAVVPAPERWSAGPESTRSRSVPSAPPSGPPWGSRSEPASAHGAWPAPAPSALAAWR
jgi:hypothetical protein